MIYYDGGSYDIIVVGAGHAGCEAALAGARMGKKTLLLTMNLDSIALMACNPAIGGTAKGHLVREVDALGGEMGLAIDDTYIQIRMLNTGKGPAVHSLRAQADKRRYHERMKSVIENTDNLYLKQAEVVELIINGGKIRGVVTACGAKIYCGALILATGVYLKSRVIVGEFSAEQGPCGMLGANSLSSALREAGLPLQRFKTGTPARVDKRTVDFSRMIPQYGDEGITPFSFMSKRMKRTQYPCYLTYTNENTHKIIRENLHRSPLYSGNIKGTGPRYCPSIEDKVVRFADKERHQLFLEPEGLSTNELYVQGMSSSLPEDVQIALYRTIAGLENVEFMRPAYAIEYDCIDPLTMQLSLESKLIGGLFTAGQINGTSGYEEAAAQGILSGINAVRYLDEEPPVILGRDQAYAGVLIDDLATKGTPEPYRMMTSRAEYRLLLRQDNADERLTQIGRDVGLVSDKRYDRLMYKNECVQNEIQRLSSTVVSPDRINPMFERTGEPETNSPHSLAALLKRAKVNYADIADLAPAPELDEDIIEQVQTKVKYEGYIDKQLKQVERFRNMEAKTLSRDIDYSTITGLRLEARIKLNAAKPENLGQAGRISGVSPADIAVLTVWLAKEKNKR